jgi:hypothetical protein
VKPGEQIINEYGTFEAVEVPKHFRGSEACNECCGSDKDICYSLPNCFPNRNKGINLYFKKVTDKPQTK